MCAGTKKLLIMFWLLQVDSMLIFKKSLEDLKTYQSKVIFLMMVWSSQQRNTPTILLAFATKKGTTLTHTTTPPSLLALKIMNLFWQVSTSMAITSKKTTLWQVLQSISDFLLLPTIGTRTVLLKRLRMLSDDASRSSTWETAIQLIRFSSQQSQKKEPECRTQKKLIRSGVSKSSEKEKIKNFGNDPLAC